MKKLGIIILVIMLTSLMYAQPYSIKEFVVINWTDQQFNGDDIDLTYDGEPDRSYHWGDTVQEYSIQKVSTVNDVISVSIKGLYSNVILPLTNPPTDSKFVLQRSQGNAVWVNLIVTSQTNQIVGINVCNFPTFGRVRHFFVANLSKYSSTLNNIKYKDKVVQYISKVIAPYSLSIFSMYPDTLNETHVQGKEVLNYNLSYNNLQKIKSINFTPQTCEFGNPNDMIVGVELSNSDVDDSLKTLY